MGREVCVCARPTLVVRLNNHSSECVELCGTWLMRFRFHTASARESSGPRTSLPFTLRPA